MKLIDVINKHECGDEITVWDNTYDLELYFYKNDDQDEWDKAMNRIASALEVVEERDDGVVVDLCNLIEKHLLEFQKEKMFVYCKVDSIMNCIDSLFAGNVSETWINKFADILMKG